MLYDRIAANQGPLRLRLDDSAVGRRPGDGGDGPMLVRNVSIAPDTRRRLVLLH
jgi:hypothetical protein